MFRRLRERPEWKFFAVLPRADRGLAFAWWAVLLLRGAFPAVLAAAMGALIGAVQRGTSLVVPLTVVGVVFVLVQVLTPFHQAISAALGSRVAAWLYDRLTEACVRPPGMGHLEDEALTSDLTVAREFDRGMTGPPMHMNMDFIASAMSLTIAGVACAAVLFAFNWWAPLVLGGAWIATHWFLRESAVWHDRNTDEVRAAQRHAEYAYRLAVDPPAAKELRLFGLVDWVMERFVRHRTRLHTPAVRGDASAGEADGVEPARSSSAPTLLVFWALAAAALDGRIGLGRVVVFAQVAVGVSAIAFGGLSWALDGAAAPVAAVLRLEAAMGQKGALAAPRQAARRAEGLPAREIRFRDVTFAYPGSARPVLEGFDLTLQAGTSLAIVGQNGAGKTTLAKLLCRLYDPQGGAIEVDGVDLRDLEVDAWRSRLAAVFQDFIRFELSLRDNVAPGGAPDPVILAALEEAGATGLAELDTPLARGYDGGTDLSGGQWQRVALARALCAVRMGAGLVLLDEPTAQLDVRGEAFIFDRILTATRNVHDHPHLPPLLHRAPRRPHLRARRGPGDRARHPRRADRPGRPLPHHVRPAGPALLGHRGRGRSGL